MMYSCLSQPMVSDAIVRRSSSDPVVAGAELPHCTNVALSSKFQHHLLHNVNEEP